jgi:hypothetical protein
MPIESALTLFCVLSAALLPLKGGSNLRLEGLGLPPFLLVRVATPKD